MGDKFINTDMLHICCLCGQVFAGFGNNPWPLLSEDSDRCCCDYCNSTKVIPARLSGLMPTLGEKHDKDK